MRDSSQSDQGKISGYLDQLVQLQRQRVELFAQEQRDLAQFMTPLQRARYTALQEQVRRARRAAATTERRDRGLHRRQTAWSLSATAVAIARCVEEVRRADYIARTARVVELVDAGDSKSPDLRVLRVRSQVAAELPIAGTARRSVEHPPPPAGQPEPSHASSAAGRGRGRAALYTAQSFVE